MSPMESDFFENKYCFFPSRGFQKNSRHYTGAMGPVGQKQEVLLVIKFTERSRRLT